MELAIDADEYKRVLGGFCSGVVVVTANHAGTLAGMTCQSFFGLSLRPPLVAFAPSLASTSYPQIRAAGHFAVNILARDQDTLARQFAVSGGDKWAGVTWTPGPAGSPMLDRTIAAAECQLEVEHQAGDHYLVVGRVLWLADGSSRSPLLFYQSSYSALAGYD